MRHRWFRLAATALGVALGVAVAASPASAGKAPTLKVSLNESGPYSETAQATVGPDQKDQFFLKARNDNPASATLLHVASSQELYKSKYFKGNRNITADVKGSGFVFTVKPTAKKFRLVVKDAGFAPEADCIGVRLERGMFLAAQLVMGINANCI